MNRTKNASRNVVFGFINRIVLIVFKFLIRTIMIRTLGADYLGLDSLYISILQVLNMAELGFSSAIVYSMYKPIAENDTTKICALMNLYKKVYRIIGLIILLVGFILLPFLKFLIKGSYPADANLYILYLIYLVNTGVTYFLFAYKSSLLKAHQRNDIISNVETLTYLIKYGLQTFILLALKNYYLFVSVQIITTVLNNIVVAIITKKKYPQYLCCGKVDELTKKDMKRQIIGLMITKICVATRNSFDSIFISTFLGLSIVAIYSNYYTIITAILTLIGIISPSIIAGIGNSIVTESEEKNYKDMNKFIFLYMWLAGWCTICLACLFQPFMKLWMGEEYMFSYGVVALLCMYFYSLKMGDIRAAYSDAKGLWYENRYRAIVESIVNIVLNILLVNFLGIYGIIIGTLVSLLIINFGYGSQILFKHYFVNEKVSDYFKKHGLYAIVTSVICVITFFLCSFISISGIPGLVIKGLICLFVPNILYFAVYFKTSIFKESLKLVKNIVKKTKKKVDVTNDNQQY